ncbi:MAG: PKD domain-containing protein, partial [Bacteroidia bacterium]|nr:PKD domain-containing protein [Bacteroidia bacterium]
MKKIFFVLAMFFSSYAFSQNVNMHTGSVSQCGGIFYDSGGSGGTYQNSENYTLTICAGIPGAQVSLNFTQFDIESGFEHLAIYEGNTSGGLLIVNATGTTLQGQTITSQGSGCLTLVFTADGSVTHAGWAAAISCTFPCQVFDVNITGANVPYFNGDTIRVCQGQPITFNAAGTYPNNNVNYPQSDATTVFTWDFGDGSPVQTGAGLSTVTHMFPNGGGYFTSVSGVDISGCNNSNYARNMVMVSTSPLFTGTSLTPDTICIGQTVNLTGMATTNPWTQPVPNIVSGLTFLPDGSGASYSTSITHTMFGPGQTLTNVNDLQSICLNMEHSYMGDLEMYLTCPNGQIINFIAATYPLSPSPGATHLGEPCDMTPATSPGVGYDYCWNPSATATMASVANTVTHSFTDLEGNSITSASYIPIGNYAPETPFTNLLGCPLNGDWTIHVIDHLGADDGYIFYWMLNFDPSIIPPLWTFGNTYNPVDYVWTGSGVGAQANGIATATPTVTGNVTYTFSATDDFGCVYDTTVTVFVETAGSPNCCVAPASDAGPDGSTCLLNYTLQAVPNIGTGSWSQISGPGTSVFSNSSLATSSVTVTTSGTYTFQWFENNGVNCTNFDQVDITFTAQPVANAGPDGQTCSLS